VLHSPTRAFRVTLRHERGGDKEREGSGCDSRCPAATQVLREIASGIATGERETDHGYRYRSDGEGDARDQEEPPSRPKALDRSGVGEETTPLGWVGDRCEPYFADRGTRH